MNTISVKLRNRAVKLQEKESLMNVLSPLGWKIKKYSLKKIELSKIKNWRCNYV